MPVAIKSRARFQKKVVNYLRTQYMAGKKTDEILNNLKKKYDKTGLLYPQNAKAISNVANRRGWAKERKNTQTTPLLGSTKDETQTKKNAFFAARKRIHHKQVIERAVDLLLSRSHPKVVSKTLKREFPKNRLPAIPTLKAWQKELGIKPRKYFINRVAPLSKSEPEKSESRSLQAQLAKITSEIEVIKKSQNRSSVLLQLLIEGTIG